jgi:hypothetical protein
MRSQSAVMEVAVEVLEIMRNSRKTVAFLP